MGTFAVKVGDAEYEVDAPDERTAYRNASNTHFAKVKGEGQKVPAPIERYVTSGEREQPSWTSPQGIAGNPVTRFATGAAAPVLGAAQLGANAVGLGGPVNEHMARFNELTQRGRAEQGSEGFDWTNAAGQALSPAALALAKGMPNAASTTGRIGQGAAIGAAAGATQPVYDTQNYWSEKGLQTVGGAAIGGAVPGAWEGAKALGRGLRNVTQPYMGAAGAGRASGRLANAAAGDKSDAVIAELRRNQELVPGSRPNAAQAASNANSPEFSALQNIAIERNPGPYSRYGGMEGAQNDARIAAVRSVGQTPQALERAIKERSAATGPMRTQALENANVAGVKGPELEGRLSQQRGSLASALRDQGEMSTRAATQETLANGGVVSPMHGGSGNVSPSAVPVPGMPRVPARLTNNADRVPEAQSAAADFGTVAANRRAQAGLTSYQLDSLAAHGQYPLTARSVTDRISGAMSAPGMRASDVVQKTLGSLKEKIASLTDERGVIDARDLYTIRKEIGNSIQQFSKETGNWDKRLTSGLERDVQKHIDDAIEGAGGSGWREYLAKFKDMSRPVEQMQVGQELEKKLVPALSEDAKQRASSYANALREAGPDIASTMEPHQMGALTGVQDDLARAAKVQDLAREGAPAANRSVNMAVPEMAPTGMFNPTISFARGLYNRVAGGATEKTLMDLSHVLQNPQLTAKRMQDAKPFERRALVDALMRYQATQVGQAGAQ